MFVCVCVCVCVVQSLWVFISSCDSDKKREQKRGPEQPLKLEKICFELNIIKTHLKALMEKIHLVSNYYVAHLIKIITLNYGVQGGYEAIITAQLVIFQPIFVL